MKGVEQLRARFRGTLLRSGEEGYDEARRIWNGAIDRRPALIACGKRRARVIERTCKLLAAGADAITFSCGIGAVLSVVLAWGGHEASSPARGDSLRADSRLTVPSCRLPKTAQALTGRPRSTATAR